MVEWKVVFLLFLSLCPLLGRCCSCFRFPNRQETLKDGICYGKVYSGVVLGATCTCLESRDAPRSVFDCRTFSYSESENTYSEEVLRRTSGNYSYNYEEFIKSCDEAESILAPGNTFTTEGVEPELRTTNSTNTPLYCPFNDEGTDYYTDGFVCVYSIRVTEVFVGNFTEGDVITSQGPDAGTSCSPDLGRILQLREEYLVGVGGPCSFFNDWSPLSDHVNEDLNTLRQLAETTTKETCSASVLSPMATLLITVLLTSIL